MSKVAERAVSRTHADFFRRLPNVAWAGGVPWRLIMYSTWEAAAVRHGSDNVAAGSRLAL
ncbi:hypothetical protein GCM10027176_36190 [Actinoallomurus bryophytorum]|uniref:Uncharacterized protein n=1 Tax=Actinoallomurus bryophytorum TaxID=1490222 RepID=A0A543CIN5_9ACTN|nr:hypothetical protein [Actinoallomurus bryophytorum]TQL96953.1 hypothetical protein FB559_2506 [Actinoallomurus bryophytorum]